MNNRLPTAAHSHGRRGVILAVVIVCTMVALVIFTWIVKTAVAQRRATDRQAWQVQASWLAESGLERAAWRLAADPDYTGETWRLSAEQLAADQRAVVEIHVETIPEQPNRRLVRAQADYPDDPQHRCREGKQAVVQLTP